MQYIILGAAQFKKIFLMKCELDRFSITPFESARKRIRSELQVDDAAMGRP